MIEAKRLNNEGISLVKEAQFGMALTHLKKAAERMHTATLNINETSSPCINDSTNAEGDHFMKDGVGCHFMWPDDNSVPLSDNTSFVQATLLPLPHKIDEDESGLTFVSIVILYNMALTYHLAACFCSDIPHASELATTLYQMVCALAVKNAHDQRLIPVILASMNNLGCLYFELGDFKTSQECLDDMAYFIMCFDGDLHFSLAQKNKFILNAILLRNPVTARAA